MKMLIIAGPYEADRIRRAAVQGGFEAVATEPGESLSGWITASRPDVIVLAPQIVSPDPEVALAKVRGVPRRRVPILMIGDADEQDRLSALGDGFFVRPVAADALLAAARDAVGAVRARGRDETTFDAQESGPQGLSAGLGATVVRTPTPTLRPLVAAPGPRLLDGMEAIIEADFDAEIREVLRAVGTLRQAQGSQPRPGPGLRDAAPPGGNGDAGADRDRHDEIAPKTLQMPITVTAALVDAADGVPTPEERGPTAGTEAPQDDEVDLELPSLLARMYLSRLSGRLTLQHGSVAKQVVFERGHPVLARSNQLTDRMGTLLVRAGRFTAAQIAACDAVVTASGRRLGTVLVERGWLTEGELPVWVRRHHQEIICSLFAWERGAWSLSADRSAAQETILLTQHPAALILEGIRRQVSAGRAERAVGGGASVLRLRLTTGASELLDCMGLTPDERNLILLFDGVRSLEDIHRLTGAPAERLYGVAWALLVLDRLEVESAAASATPSGTGPRGDAAPPPANTGDDPAIVQQRAWVRSCLALVDEGDYFQILNVSRDADGPEIGRALDGILAKLDAAAQMVPDMAAQVAGIRAIAAEAARLLANDGIRARYRAHLPASPPADTAAGPPL